MSELKQCSYCEGKGQIPIGEHFVTHDMALDACEPSMEGMSYGIEWGTCPECQGGGLLESKEEADETK